MERDDCNVQSFPKEPGVYIFRDSKKKILYIGRATELRSRISSYFSGRLVKERGPRIQEALEKTTSIETIVTDSVLDAYLLEANLIQKNQPQYNVVSKDNKSFLFVGITKEEYPRVLIVRGRELENEKTRALYKKLYGPFPRGTLLKEALQIIRKILPYRDTCTPAEAPERVIGKRAPRKCMRAEIGLCPGVCAGEISKKEYAKRIRDIMLFFEGKKKQLVTSLEKEMKEYAKEQEFEKAQKVKNRIFSLRHIQDAHLIKREFAEGGNFAVGGAKNFRIEAYDIAHSQGTNAVGAMVVFVNKEKTPSEYRSFSIRTAKKGDDLASLTEVLERRFKHSEWTYPQLIVIDGGATHLKVAKRVLEGYGIQIPVVSVVKTRQHTARELLGDKEYAKVYEQDILLANEEAHRFALSKHKQRRTRSMFFPFRK